MTLSRREFLEGTTGLGFGILITPHAAQRAWGAETSAAADAGSGPVPAPYAWVHIAPTGIITIRTPSDEIGQGSMTALPLILAEELDAEWNDVAIEFCPADDAIYGNPNLGGLVLTVASWAVNSYYDRLRLHGAQMRRILLDNAARHWNVPSAELSTEPSRVIHAASGRRLSYGEIAAFAELPETPPAVEAADLKPRDRFRLIGSDVQRRDIPSKTNGSAQYAIDVQLPGMAFASVIRPSLRGARVKSFDAREVTGTSGVLDVVDLGDRVAVVAESQFKALQSKNAVHVAWDRSSTFDSDAALEQRAAQVRDLSLTGFPWQADGDIEAALGTAAQTYTAEYRSDYVYHAQLEPLNAVASPTPGGGIEAWAGTQAPSHCVRAIAAATGIETGKVVLHRLYSGGAFGRRGAADQDYVVDAAVLSQRFKRPVKVVWSREDDVRLGRLKPMSAQYLRAGVDGSGAVVAWHHRVASEEPLSQGDPLRYEKWGKLPISAIFGSEQSVYGFPNCKAEHILQETDARLSPLRGVGATPNRFAGESFLDEIALAQGVDPLAMRLRLVAANPRATKVLQLLAEHCEWQRPRTDTAVGLAFTAYHETMLACAAEISLDENSGRIRVHHLWSVVDAGLLIQPGNAESQVQGGLLFGLGHALIERVSIRNGEIQHSNYHDYPVMRMGEVPDVHVHLLQGMDVPSAVGEVGALLPAGAVGNAFARLTGKRLRHMPFTPERVRAALAS